MKRYGRQTPTFEYVGAYDHSDGPEAVALFALAYREAMTTKRRPGRKAVVY